MSYNSSTKRITAPVSIRDVQQCFGLSSGDLVTLIRTANINIWARYKPTPCLIQNANNTPRALSDLQRAQENYGLEIADIYYSAGDGTQAWEEYANELDLSNPYSGATKRAWANGMYYRLSDFAKVANGLPVSNVGYDHKAQPASVVVTVGGVDFTLRPTIPAAQRIINVVENGIFEFPRDCFWMETYYKITTGTLQPSASNKVTLGNPEWLSVLDFISGARFSVIVDASKIRHGLVIFQKDSNNVWKYVCRIFDRDDTSGSDVSTRNFSQHPEAFADFTDTSTTNVGSPATITNLNQLDGDYLFVDYWNLTYSNAASEYQPIIGMAYQVTINRSSTIISLDVEGALVFTRFDIELYYNSNETILTLHFDYNPNVIDIDVDIADDPPSSYPARTQILAALQQHYSYLAVVVGGRAFNVLTGIVESSTDADATGSHGWNATHHAICVLYMGTYIDYSSVTQVTVVANRNDIGYTRQLTKTIPAAQA